MTFEEVKRDYLEIIEEAGIPYDMTGGFVAEEQMEKVIRNPTKRNAKNYMINVIEYGFQWGDYWKSQTSGEISINDNEVVRKIYDKYVF